MNDIAEINSITNQFNNPPSEFRGAPFWAWNGKLDPDELREQIRIMKQMGLGGFFMHSRVGLATEYLGEEWFDCVNACIDEAEKLDMQAWLYDEDRWPSGAAGGIVTANPEFRARKLAMTICKSADDISLDNIVALFAAKLNDNTASEIRRIDTDDIKLKQGETLLYFHIIVDKPTPWHNNQTYLDTLNENAVSEFIKVTHEKYKEQISKHFGKRVPGIFTDEPNHSAMCIEIDENTITVPWTNSLPEVFAERYGYDIIERIPEIFLDLEGIEISRARYHFHDCVTHLFVNAFSRQIGKWCDKNNLQLTGHVLEEDSLSRQVNSAGSCMRFYEYMQAPGMDLLTEHWRIYDTAKQVTSAARQFGREIRLSETYGCTGWDFPFVGHKALGDWQTALGINLRCQHLFWYTMLGEAKRDYPASISHHSPWWEDYAKVEDYFARINLVMSRGDEIRNLLVIHPNESMWCLCRKGWNKGSDIEAEDVAELNEKLVNLRDSLLYNNIDFDYGDEEIMSRLASVESKNGITHLKFGNAAYSAVLLPPMLTIRSSTIKILREFADKGGKVFFAGTAPEYMDALPSDEPADLAEAVGIVPESGAELAVALETARVISITDENGRETPNTLFLLKEDNDFFYLFICNTGHSQEQRESFSERFDDSRAVERKTPIEHATVTGFSGCSTSPLELDPDTGEIFETDYVLTENGQIRIRTSFPALGSRIFLIPKKQIDGKFQKRTATTVISEKQLDSDWNFSLSEHNSLVMNFARYRVDEGAWSPEKEILEIDAEIRTAMGCLPRGGAMVQPWAREKRDMLKKVKVELEYTFTLNKIPSSPLFLGIEVPETFAININGVHLDSDSDAGYWCDKSLRKLSIDTSLLKPGENILRMQCDYDEEHPGLEYIYLLGNFGVDIMQDGNTVIMELPQTVSVGDWTVQGLPFYSGSVLCETEQTIEFKNDELVFVSVPDYDGVAVRVLVDNRPAGIIAWEPNEIEITEHIESGKTFKLGIEVIGHRRNSHGPFHLEKKWPAWTGSGSFRVVERRKYNLVPFGLPVEPLLTVKQQVTL